MFFIILIMKKVYCAILNKNFIIDYTSKGLNQFNCSKAFVDSDAGIFCEANVQYEKCPVYNLIDRFAKINSKALDELIKG